MFLIAFRLDYIEGLVIVLFFILWERIIKSFLIYDKKDVWKFLEFCIGKDMFWEFLYRIIIF